LKLQHAGSGKNFSHFHFGMQCLAPFEHHCGFKCCILHSLYFSDDPI
jgi:hypothetical protein